MCKQLHPTQAHLPPFGRCALRRCSAAPRYWCRLRRNFFKSRHSVGFADTVHYITISPMWCVGEAGTSARESAPCVKDASFANPLLSLCGIEYFHVFCAFVNFIVYIYIYIFVAYLYIFIICVHVVFIFSYLYVFRSLFHVCYVILFDACLAACLHICLHVCVIFVWAWIFPYVYSYSFICFVLRMINISMDFYVVVVFIISSFIICCLLL